MRKINLIVIALVMIAGVTSCSGGGTSTPEEIGQHAFKVLKDFDAKKQKDFDKNFMTIEELRDLSINRKVIPDLLIRNTLTSIEKDEWADHITKSYSAIKNMGEDNAINWKKIEYSDFTYKVDYEEEVPMNIEGELIFMYKEEKYKLYTFSMWNGKEYLLVKMDNRAY